MFVAQLCKEKNLQRFFENKRNNINETFFLFKLKRTHDHSVLKILVFCFFVLLNFFGVISFVFYEIGKGRKGLKVKTWVSPVGCACRSLFTCVDQRRQFFGFVLTSVHAMPHLFDLHI